MVSDITRDIPEFGTVLLHSRILKNSNGHERVELWAKSMRFREFRTPFPPHDIRKIPRSMYARVPQAMAQFATVPNRKIVPYHRGSPNTRNGARLRSPSSIMAPAFGRGGTTLSWGETTVIPCKKLKPTGITL